VDKETLEKLIADQPKEIRAKGVLLFNGAAQCAQTYQSAPTAANLRDWEAAQAALAKFSEQIGVNDDAERPFPSIADVLDYLRQDGWRVTKTSLYRHQKEGKFLPQRDGSYARKDIDKYARVWLKQQSTGKRIAERTDELQRKKLDQELKNLEIEYERKRLALDKEQEKYIPKELMEVELASRAGILNAGLKHWIQSRAADWIRAAGGDTKRAGELINLMSRDLDEHINSYAAKMEYEVVVDAEEEAADEIPETGEEPTGEEGK
jgi:hypothetical protein